MSDVGEQSIFSIRFKGDDVSLRSIPTRALADLLDAVQKIISDLRSDGDPVSLHLVGVRKGSAVYRLESAAPYEQVRSRLDEFGLSIKSEGDTGNTRPLLDEHILGPLETLGALVKRYGGQNGEIELRGKGGGRNVLARIGPDTYQNFESSSLIAGDTSVYGRLERLGGKDRYHCAIRIPQQKDRQLWCSVESEELVSELGKYMFQGMVFHGIGTWYKKSGYFRKLRIRHFDPPTTGTFRDMFQQARKVGGDGWDHVKDVNAELAEIRSE